MPNKQVIENTPTAIDEVLKNKPDLIVAGVSGNQVDICVSLVQEALRRGVPVVKLIDFWGTGMPHEQGLAVTKACVLDAPSQAYEARMRGMPLEDIVVTGAPQFDTLVSVTPIAELVKDEEDPLIIFYGPSSEFRVREILDPFMEALVQSDMPVRFGGLWHPKSKTDSYVPKLVELFSASPNITVLEDQWLRQLAGGQLDRLTASADLVVGSTSTELVAACYQGRPTLSIVPPNRNPNETDSNLWTNLEMIARRGVEQMPTSEVGASLHVESTQQILELLSSMRKQNQLWQNKLGKMRTAQQAHYTLNGKNTERVVGVIESLIK